jgi:photosystem II cytochrome b559 subunit alpha
MKYLFISTGERPIVDILQDRRYWVIHIITIPALFISGVVSVASGISFNIAGTPNWLAYLSSTTSLSLVNDRFSVAMYLFML